MKRFLAVGLMAIVSLSAMAQDGKVAFAPKEGDSRKYSIRMNMSVGGADVVLKSNAVQTVKKVVEAQVEEELKYEGFSVELSGTPMEGMEPLPVSTTSSFAGQLLKISGGLAGTDVARLHLLGVFVPPAKALAKDEVFSVAFKGSEDKLIPATKYEVVYLGNEKVGEADLLKFKMKYSEAEADGMKFEGTYWVTSAGVLVKAEGTFEEMFIPQAGANASGKFVIEPRV